MRKLRIYYSDGDQYRDPDTGQEEFTAAEAADVAERHPWADLDRDGDLIIKEYRSRSMTRTDITGRAMARRLRRRVTT